MIRSHFILAICWILYCVLHSALANDQLKARITAIISGRPERYRLGYNVIAFAGLFIILSLQVSIKSIRLFKANHTIIGVAFFCCSSRTGDHGYLYSEIFPAIEWHQQQSRAGSWNIRHSSIRASSTLFGYVYFFNGIVPLFSVAVKFVGGGHHHRVYAHWHSLWRTKTSRAFWQGIQNVSKKNAHDRSVLWPEIIQRNGS